jgi:diguanylate cyclase (GGDEF)-like protein/PAS domain S-box-containing protein
MAYGKTIGFLRCSMMTRYLDLSRQLGRLQAGLCVAATQRRRSAGGDGGRLSNACLTFVAAFFFSIAFFGTHALAVEPIVIGPDDERIDITLLGEFYDRRGDKLSVETAPSADGIVGRMTVSAKTAGTNPSWVVFALSNPTDKPVLRWLTAQRYDVVGSHVIKPDLDAPRITNVTPSLGFRPERNEDYDYLDIYRISIEPGTTVTFIVELASASVPRLYLSSPASFGKRERDLSLFHGILLGITGLLAIFLTAIFAANHKAIFPAAALVGWAALAYLCVDFGFWHKLFQLTSEDNGTYRAAAEAAFAASLVVFLYTFLNLRLWHSWISVAFFGWIVGQLGLIVFALVDAQLTAGLARFSFVPIAVIGSALISFLALRGQERALSLVPCWMLFMVWLFASAVTITGKVSGDVVVSALSAGLVLFLALIGFTVTQYAFQTNDPGAIGEDAGQFKLRVMALEASGASVWEWDGRRNEINTGPEIEAALGIAPGSLRCAADSWLQYLHASDRERMRLTLWTVRERQGGDINLEFRMKRADGGYSWYELRAAVTPQRTTRALRGVGLMRNVTAQKRAQERLLHNAIRDGLTGLPNRELFLDRLQTAVARARDENIKPTVFFIDLDALKSQSRSPDFSTNDGVLLTIARRLTRHIAAQDTLARVSALQFAILISDDTEPRHIAMLAERVRRSLRTPMKVGGRDLVMTGSIGIAMFDGNQENAESLLREAESAMYRAKRAGADRIELFKPEMRGAGDERSILQSDLKHAIERRQIRVLYQPIMRIADERLAGMEAFVLWDHPTLGRLSLPEFEASAEAAGLSSELWTYVFERCIRQGARWHRILQRDDPIFVSINMSSEQLFHHDLVQNLRLIIGRETLPKGALRLEIAENLINANPEQAIEILDWLKSLNVSVALDEFGVSFSSLSYWHRLSIDAIKIDRSLVTLSDKERSSAMVLKAVLTIAHELGKDVIAVGVDSEEDLGYVRAVGCDFGQGFFYSELMTEREVVNLLNAIARSTRRDDKEQEREEKRAERKAEKEKEREEKEREKEKEKALALAEAEAKASAPPPPAGKRRGENGNRRPRLGSRLAASQDGNGAAATDRSRAEIQSPPPPPQGADPRAPTQRDGSRSSFSIGRRGK